VDVDLALLAFVYGGIGFVNISARLASVQGSLISPTEVSSIDFVSCSATYSAF
jgi:hypothetical protein